MTATASSTSGTHSPRATSALAAQAPRPAAHAWEAREHEVGGGLDVGAIRVPFAGIDQEHLASAHLARLRPIIEMKPALGHDERDWDRVAMLRNVLPRIEPQADDAHRPAVRDLLKTKWAMLFSGWLRHRPIMRHDLPYGDPPRDRSRRRAPGARPRRRDRCASLLHRQRLCPGRRRARMPPRHDDGR